MMDPLFAPMLGMVERHPLAMTDPALAAVVDFGFNHHVLPGVVGSYKTARKAYVEFCEVRGLRPWPTDAILLSGFVHVICLRIKVTSLKVYLAGIPTTSMNMAPGPWKGTS